MMRGEVGFRSVIIGGELSYSKVCFVWLSGETA